MAALERLKAQTGEGRFDHVLALVRRPKDAADAYVSMVEENEVRVGLSYYERARVAAQAVKRVVFETEKAALLSLFASARRAKRSRIRSFIELYHVLDGHLKFLTANPERLGLAIVDVLRRDDSKTKTFQKGLEGADAQTPEAELEALSALARPAPSKPNVPRAEHLKQTLPNGLKASLKSNKIEIAGKPVFKDLYHQISVLLAEKTKP